jgi:hypothetical protein
MKRILLWPVIAFIRLAGASMHLMFMQAEDAKSVLLTGECRQLGDEPKKLPRKERISLTSDEVCQALIMEAI